MKSRSWKWFIQDSNSYLSGVSLFLKITSGTFPSAFSLALTGSILPLTEYFTMTGDIFDRRHLGVRVLPGAGG